MTTRKTRTVIAVALSLIMALAYMPCAAFAADGDQTQDIEALKQAMDEAEGIMNTAKTEMDTAEEAMEQAKTDWENKKTAAKEANDTAIASETAAATAEQARDDAFAQVKEDAQAEYEAAEAAYTTAQGEYKDALADYQAKAGELNTLTGQKTTLEGEVSQLQSQLTTAQQEKADLEAELPELQAAVTTATNKWHADQQAAQNTLEQAQAAFDAAGRSFIDAKINEQDEGYDLDDMIAACKTYNSNSFSNPVTDDNGTTYSTIADIANSQNFEKIIDRACAYENLKKDISFMREANAHRGLAIHNAEDLRVSYQLMGTAIISASIDEYLTGHNLNQKGDTEWSFWNSGNSMISGENLAYSPVSDARGWDPFHGWYYKERMKVIANERGVAVNQDIVDEILAESTANGFPYNPYGAPWNQSKEYFLSSIGTQTGHYTSLINNKFKATGFCYVDASEYALSSYPYVASQEFNGDTSDSVSIKQYEEELDAWFEGYLSDLDSAQSAVDALATKPKTVTDAEAALTAKQDEIDTATQNIATINNQITEKTGQITTLTSQIEKKKGEVDTARTTKDEKETAMGNAQAVMEEKETANTKAQNLDPKTPSTYEDYKILKDAVAEVTAANEQATADRAAATAAQAEAETAQTNYNDAVDVYNTKKTAYDTAVTNYNTAKAAYQAALKVSINGAKVVLVKASATYNGAVQKPVVKTIDGNALKLGTDYTLTIKNSSGTTVASPKAAGTYYVTVEGTGHYEGTAAKATYKILKAKNPLTIKAKTATVKYSKLKKKNQTLKRAAVIYMAKNQGKVTYVKSSGNKKITINKTTGKVTVKKGLKKGKYKVKVNVTAAGNNNYNKITKAVTFTVKVK